MSELSDLLAHFELKEGLTASHLEGVSFFKTERMIPRTPLIYEPGIYMITRGRKFGYLGERTFRYDADNYLVVSVATPFECEANASPDDPVTGIFLAMNIPMLHELSLRLSQEANHQHFSRGDSLSSLDAAHMNPELRNAVIRLVASLGSKVEAEILGPGILKEIFYRVLMGGQGASLHALLNQHSNFSRIAVSLRVIHNDYRQKLDVEHLAETANMSLSTFHRAFKEITTDSPLQYLKKVRLTKARDLLLQKQAKVYIVAEKVGYESQSQFSREFKRYFGQGPADLIRQTRNFNAAFAD